MSLTVRRTSSWVLTLAVLIAIVVGVRRLPGSGGLIEELRWLLGGGWASTNVNRATLLLYYTEQTDIAASVEMLRQLLDDPDDRVVTGAYLILTDRLPPTIDKCARDSSPFVDLLVEWREKADARRMIAHADLALSGFHVAGVRAVGNDAWRRVEWDATFAESPIPVRQPDKRCMVAVTLPDARTTFTDGVFRQRWVQKARLDSIYSRWEFVSNPHARPDYRKLREARGEPIRALGDAELAEQLRLTPEELREMLSDPIDEVRWGAGRMLAIAGDARGIPAVCEWLAANPRWAGLMDELMRDLYGPGWRAFGESRGAASQPGEGGGG